MIKSNTNSFLFKSNKWRGNKKYITLKNKKPPGYDNLKAKNIRTTHFC